MADLPPEQPDSTDENKAVPVPAPQLLVMPPNDAIPSMVWPGTEGETAWAIPVQIPSGTRGYALFVPMVAAPASVPAVEKPVVKPPVTTPKPAENTTPKPPPAVIPQRPAPQRPAPQSPPYAARPFGRYEPAPSPWQAFRKKNWPAPKEAQGWAVPAGVLAGALGFLIFLPLDRVGIGWFLGWLALTLGVGFAVHKSPDLPRRERLIRAGWAAAALALMLIPAFRNAWWLVTFSVLGAIGCTALAIVGGRQVRSILFSLIAAPYAAFAGIPWVRRHLKASPNPGIARRAFFSVALTVVVLLVFGALLSSADVAFSQLLDDVIPDFAIGSVFQWIFLAVAGGLLAVSGIYTLTAPPKTSSLDTEGRGRFGLIEWAPAGAALVLLFGGFVAVQFTVLFGGSRHVLKTAGLSYSQYARSGFWQLVAVTLLSLALIAALARWAKRDQPIERLLLRVLLGLLCALSVVIVASALSRMWEYQRVYSFTGERIFVMASEMLLGVIFVLIAVAGIKWQGRWIPATTVGLAVLMLLGLAALDPEGYVASRNAARYAGSGKIDAWYLRALSADATPALTKLPDPVRRCTLSWIAEDLKEPDPWYAWNLGRVQARQALKELGPGAIGNQKDCKSADQFDLPKTRR
ncbi:hypothetical protein BJ973_000514 [Actinoplanes tereljensis]|uniref:DUF4173 domain-containing protein n=1 Tax=Paractinoplanes tereljensis TaxID=571912 RepID=A0A919NRS1_9ACTN|nr:DUF4173 domain-containing protein [Actinoplanes tereljensis]GIF23128.1 hypothetical protein Ate02nite_58580 [Actinoplanes tereljensis]